MPGHEGGWGRRRGGPGLRPRRGAPLHQEGAAADTGPAGVVAGGRRSRREAAAPVGDQLVKARDAFFNNLGSKLRVAKLCSSFAEISLVQFEFLVDLPLKKFEMQSPVPASSFI